MIRLRSQKLLSGVSTLAVLAALGMTDPAVASQTITAGTNPNPPVTNAVSTAFIDIQTGAVVLSDGSGRSVINSGTLTSFLTITAATLTGSVSNTGGISGSGVLAQTGANLLGGLTNTGSISGNTFGFDLDGSFLNGGIHNTGTAALISASSVTAAGILFSGTSVATGGVTNDGTITAFGFGGTGISLQATSVLVGDISNSTTGTISGFGIFFGAGINLSGVFAGNIDNSGLITGGGGTGADGILLSGGVLAGSIINHANAVISASGGSAAAIGITGGTLAGNIDNTGTITAPNFGINVTGGLLAGTIINNAGGTIAATAQSGNAISLSGGTITGGISNAGKIVADGSTGVGISMTGGVLSNGITNSGLISGNGTNGVGILISGGTITGGITNTSTGTILGSTGILVSVATFAGNIVNDGTINTQVHTDDAIRITSTTFTGNVTNSATGLISADDTAIEWTGTTFNGTITNAGKIVADSTGIRLSGTTLNGNVVNSGNLQAGSDGIRVSGATTVNGTLTNSGTIAATNSDGIQIDGTITGNVVNSGTIIADTDGIKVNGVVQGSIINSGTIDPAVGIDINGHVIGGVFVTNGLVTGTTTGIDVSGATALHTITQTGGTIQGRTADNLTITSALNMNNAFADVFNGNGGTLDGNVTAAGGDNFVMTPAGTFTYLRGTATGLAAFNKAGAGTAFLGASGRGVDGEGVIVNAATMAFSAGNLYLDDDTTINLTGALTQTSTGTLEYFLKAGTLAADYGSIISGAVGSLGAATHLAANIDPVTFGAGGLVTTYVYQDIVSNIGATNFVNATNVATSSIFFTGTATNDGANIDLRLDRKTFANVLNTLGETQNQNAVGGALDAIFDNLVISSQTQALFAELFAAGLTGPEIQAIFDELSGSQHAQIQQQTLSVDNIFNNMVGERLDAVLVTEDGTRMSGLVSQQYAQALGATASDAMGGGMGSQGLTRGPSGVSVWLRGFGQWANIDGDQEASGYQQDSNGLVGGVDVAVNPNATFGGALSYAKTNTDFDTSPDQADIDSWQGGLYGSYGLGHFYVDGIASYASHDVSATRFIPVDSSFAASSYNSTAWSVNGELGAIWRLGRVNMQPSAAITYTAASTDGFSETGAGNLGLTVQSADSDSLASTLAVRAAGQWMMGRTAVVPDIKVGWRHEFGDDRQSFTANFIEDLSSGAAFTIISSHVQPDSMVVSTGLTAGVTKNFEVFVDVNGQYSSDTSSTNASGGLRFTW